MQAIESEIEAVTVYSAGALVTRAARLAPDHSAWPAQVRITGLPLALDDASLTVRCDDGGPKPVSFRIALEAPDEPPAVEPPCEEAVRDARKEVLALEGRLKDVERLIGRVTRMSVPARPAPHKGEAPPPSPHEGRMALIEFRRQRLRALNAIAGDLRRKLRGAREALADAQDRRRRATAEREPRADELRKTVVVALTPPEAGGAGDARLRLEYHVPGARWAPSYSFHFDKDLSRTALSARAVVAQRTGEDWRNVRLTLSTADMQAWTELPELASLRLGRWQSPPRTGWRPLPAGADELYADYDRESAAIEKTAASKAEDTGEFAVTAAASEALPPPQAEPPEASVLRRTAGSPRGLLARMTHAETPALRLPAAAPAPEPPPSFSPGEFTRMFTAAAPPAPVPPPLAEPAVLPPSAAPVMAPREPGAPLVPASLDYTALRIPGPDAVARGKLTRLEAAASVEVFAEVQVKVRVDTASVVRAARSDAGRIGDLPVAHAFPTSVEGFDYAYRAELPVSIPSDGRFHSIPLLSREGEARPYYVTVPRETPDVFRFAEIDNPLDAPLLPGPVDISIGNAFLMTAPLRLTPAKGIVKLGMGVEQRIKVARNTAFAEEASGLMGGTLNLKHDIDIELRNLLRVPAQIEVRERVPVTRDGEEHVKVTATAKPPWENYDPPEGSLRGGYRWRIQVQPAEVVRLHASYTISMPSKMEIATGNRREQ